MHNRLFIKKYAISCLGELGHVVTAARKNLTMKDVAKAVGVSVSTASRALNGLAQEYRISEATAKAIQEAAEQLGYQPSLIARSLRLKKTSLMGIVVPDLSNPFFSSIARAVTMAAEKDGFSAILADSDGDTEKERVLIDQMVSRSVESLIVCPVGLEFAHLERAAADGLPLVTVDRCKRSSSMVQVTSDHMAGGRLAMETLLQQGHRHIGILQGLAGTLPCQLRLQGAREALTAVHRPLPPELVAGDRFSFDSGYQSAKTLLQRFPQMTAFFAMSTPNAFGAVRAVSELGLRIPEDLSLICFDDVPFADLMQVPISTVAQDVPELGRLATSLAMEQLQLGKTSRKKMHKIPVKLISRTSISCPPAGKVS